MTKFEEKIPSEESKLPVKESEISNDEGITPETKETQVITPTESRTRNLLRNIVRWTLTLLITFGLGAITVYLAYLAPTQKDLKQSRADLEEMTKQADSLTNQLDEITKTNEELELELSSAQVRLVLLNTLSDVRAANLSVVTDDYPGALLSLRDAAQALEQLGETVDNEQRDVVTALQDSLTEIEDELKGDPESTKMDLDRLITNLVRLENSIIK